MFKCPCCPVNHEFHVKGNRDRKKTQPQNIFHQHKNYPLQHYSALKSSHKFLYNSWKTLFSTTTKLTHRHLACITTITTQQTTTPLSSTSNFALPPDFKKTTIFLWFILKKVLHYKQTTDIYSALSTYVLTIPSSPQTTPSHLLLSLLPQVILKKVLKHSYPTLYCSYGRKTFTYLKDQLSTTTKKNLLLYRPARSAIVL